MPPLEVSLVRPRLFLAASAVSLAACLPSRDNPKDPTVRPVAAIVVRVDGTAGVICEARNAAMTEVLAAKADATGVESEE